MKVALRADCDYSSVPVSTEFEPQISIAGGISAPKIAVLRASDGSRNKMLLKGGNDDLRQDAIMEQVFEQVSDLLKDHRATRQRRLGIRTYKVVPLFYNAGVIEFVQGTLPLNDYLNPAHVKYFPKDYRPNKCRKDISDAQSKTLQQRVQVYRNAAQHFHPVMRFFFTEYFLDPDDWFYKRLNYSRSTAAISILGHVLGLGDRHGHNILLDTHSGEVVHIDLGVAFEAGRILPVPEVVPFRLTRDLVDAMGISGVEGVFRRCCNFTLEALRRDQDSIMTILDVLRYDPLYSWSLSPLRLQKIQETAEQLAAAAAAQSTAASTSISATTNHAPAGPAAGIANIDAQMLAAGLAGRREINEPSEADRALTVVSKKLGKSLSVEATVNELIRQATDERNLAVLYYGWAAYL
jgi:ataxia telangiectasia mutated family protein